jgi:hypothetical protein
MYAPNEYDLAGFCVGVVNKRPAARRPLGEGGRRGRRACFSSGLHSNGYSLARKALLDVAGTRSTAGRRPRAHPRRGAARADEDLRRRACAGDALGQVHALAHITGGGLPGNVPRVLPDGVGVVLDPRRWPRPEIFDLIQRAGDIEEAEMRRTFNLGLGLVLSVEAQGADSVLRAPSATGSARPSWARWWPPTPSTTTASPSSADEPGARRGPRLRRRDQPPGAARRRAPRARSGRGGRAGGAQQARRARPRAGRSARASPRGDAITATSRPGGLRRRGARSCAGAGVELVVLAGFMRVLTDASSTPSPTAWSTSTPRCCRRFPGCTRRPRRWRTGVKISGCTVHFVDAGLDTGPIIAQAAVPVLDDDTEETLRRGSSRRSTGCSRPRWPTSRRGGCGARAGASTGW